MRVYIDGVLRFGIPPKFYIGIIQPSKGKDNNILTALTKLFAEDGMHEMYGSKEDAGDTEDFFPFVQVQLNAPLFLMV